MHRYLAVLTLVAAAVVALPAAPAPAAKKKVVCSERAGDTIYRDRTLRVIQKVKRSKSDPDANTVKLTYCTPFSKNAPKTLVTFSNDLDGSQSIQRVVRGGQNHLALELDGQTGTADFTSLHVYSLVTRKRDYLYGSENGFSWTVTRSGGVAVLEGGKVTGWDAAGERVLAATGAAALASVDDQLYWTAGGAAATATLTGVAKRG